MDRDLPGPSGVRIITRKQMFEKMQEQDLPTFDKKLEYIEKYLCGQHSAEQKKEIKYKFSNIKFEFKRRWIAAKRSVKYFSKVNEKWLQQSFEVPIETQRSGRPLKPFEECSERSKRRRTEGLRSTDEHILTHAVQIKLQTSGKRDASKIIKEMSTSPKRARKIRKAYVKAQHSQKTQLSPIQALSMFVEGDFSRRQYELVRSTNKHFYPCYSILQKTKKECYPDKRAYKVSQSCVEINLQELLNVTIKRLAMYLEEVLERVEEDERHTLQLICKWGCDGSQQAQFKQKIESGSDDAHIFQSSFVPLRIIYGKNKEKTLWQNPTPSSPRYCRPIRIRYIKETATITNEEISYVENEIRSLSSTELRIKDKSFSVKHIMMLTMVDAKVCNAATQTASTMKCYICGATSKDFNNLNIKKEVEPNTLRFGLSVLHARIRLLESLLNISYKLPIKKWRLTTETDKNIVKQRKAEIQKKIRDETGLIVHVPKAGFGNTNDGNTSRRFFADPKVAADITGLNVDLIFKLKVILEVISSGHKINVAKFGEYCLNTAKLYVNLYAWHPMTPTMHKLLIHGADVVEHALLPIGQLSEEAAEARNKHFRMYRMNFARKFSREECNLDVFNRLLLSSDPLLTSMRAIPKHKSSPFLTESLELLLPAEPKEKDNHSSEGSSSEEEVISDEDWA